MRIKVNVLTVMAVITMLLQPDILAQKQSALPPAPEKTPATVFPVIINGEAQKIPSFENSDEWIKHDLWVEAEFDTDGDGKKDRMHVDVTRPRQTETDGLRLPVIYESSPYFAGTGSTASQYFWNVRQELNADPLKRIDTPPIVRRGQRPVISTSQTRTWIPYGFIVVHSSAPGTGLSQGCPTIGTRIEAKAPRGNHPRIAQQLILSLLPFKRTGPQPRRISRRRWRLLGTA